MLMMFLLWLLPLVWISPIEGNTPPSEPPETEINSQQTVIEDYIDTHKFRQFINSETLKENIVDRFHNRPTNCPLSTNLKLAEIQDRLIQVSSALKKGRCYANNQTILNGFDELFQNSEGFLDPSAAGPMGGAFGGGFGAPPPGAVPGGNPTRPIAIVNPIRRRQILQVMSKVAQDTTCLSNFKQKGLLPTVANLATNVGLVGSVIPSSNGMLVGAAGLTLGTSLKILSGLFEAPFDWRKNEERQQFLDINCAYFQLRRDIEYANVYDLRDEHIDAKIQQALKQQEVILNYLKELSEKQEVFMAGFQTDSTRYIKKELGEGVVEFHRSMGDILNLLEKILSPETSDTEGNQLQVQIIDLSVKSLPTLKPFIQRGDFFKAMKSNLTIFQSNYSFVSELIEKLNANLVDFHALPLTDFKKNFAFPMFHYLEQIYQDVNKIFSPALHHFWHMPRSPKQEITQASAYHQIQDAFDYWEQQLKVVAGRLELRIATLKSKDRKLEFSATDESTHASYSILEQSRQISNKINGSIGYSFLKYLRKSLAQEHQNFISHLRHFKQKYETELNSPTPVINRWFCRDANGLRSSWDKARATREVIYDFVSTNSGIFHTDIPKRRHLFGAIPFGTSSQKKLLQLVQETEKTVEDIKNHKMPTQTDFFKNKQFKSRTIHNQFQVHQELLAERTVLETTWAKMKCYDYL
ncbi:MAG: hypothetical protein OXT67_11410 [Zetaproteobacteria bacterium]|nr:hypothetical protein [Zetaproteobacteria bacterium]